jgi:hypothetical protein
MADLIAADPTLDPDIVLDGWATDLWDALVFNVRRATAVGGCHQGHPGTARGLAGRAAADAGGAARNRQRRAAMDRPFPRESRVPPAISRSASSTAGSTWTDYRISTTKPPGQS